MDYMKYLLGEEKK